MVGETFTVVCGPVEGFTLSVVVEEGSVFTVVS